MRAMEVDSTLLWLQALGPYAIGACAIAAATIGACMIGKQIATTRELAREDREEERRRLAAALYYDVQVTRAAANSWARRVVKRWLDPDPAFRTTLDTFFAEPFPSPVLLFDIGESLGRLRIDSSHWTAETISLLRAQQYRYEAARQRNEEPPSSSARGLAATAEVLDIAAQLAARHLGEEAGLDVSRFDADALRAKWRELVPTPAIHTDPE